jgi:hypothetical protein
MIRPGPVRLIELAGLWQRRAAERGLDPGTIEDARETVRLATGSIVGPFPPVVVARLLDSLEGGRTIGGTGDIDRTAVTARLLNGAAVQPARRGGNLASATAALRPAGADPVGDPDDVAG